MITFICDESAKEHLITNIMGFNPRSLTICEDLSGTNRIKAEIIVSNKELPKVIDYLKEHYVKQFNGNLVYLTDFYSG